MFGLTQIEERLAWLALVVIVIFGFAWHERSVGATKCELSDAKIASIQKAAQAAQEALDAQRLRNAQDDYQLELATLQHARDTEPVSHLVCESPRPQPVSTASQVPQTHPSSSGSLPPEGSRDTFDPGPALDGLHDEADLIVAQCRELDAAVPH